MKVQEAVYFPAETDQGLKRVLTKWMREAALRLNNDTSDVIIDLATKGLVLKDTQSPAHYWRVTINNLGVLVTTDLGTGKP
jgi:hypothetical protein